MNIKSAAAALGAALIVAASPVIASAATTQPSPLRLDSVQIAQYYGQFNEFFPGRVTVAFTNEASLPITNVVFDVEAGGKVVDRIKDAGSFPQGQTVKHSFPNFTTNYNTNLAVESVTFSDGSTWTSTDEAGSRRQAAQNVDAPAAANLFPYQLLTN